VTEPLATYETFDGSAFEVLERPGGPEDALLMRFRFTPETGAPPPHIHPHSVETFEVEDGAFELSVNGEWRRLEAGETLDVPAGTPHTFRIPDGKPVTVRNVHEPHAEFENYIKDICALSQKHRTSKFDKPSIAPKSAVILGRYPDLMRPVGPMRIVMSALRLVARVARLTP
jgi:quercetin dioxygenase-like cupin family protein